MNGQTSRRYASIVLAAVILTVAGCSSTAPPPAAPSSPGAAETTAPAGSARPPAAGGYTKVLVIAEENHSYDEIIGNPAVPYINQLATTYGSATRMDAGYPTACPSLAAYVLLTSGSTHGICDD